MDLQGMGVYYTKEFARFARKAGLPASRLIEAARDVASGRHDADLGGGVFKQRVARDGSGKSGGYRTILVFRVGGHAFFVHGFAKSAKANVSTRELQALRRLAHLYLSFDDEEITIALAAGELTEPVRDENADEQG